MKYILLILITGILFFIPVSYVYADIEGPENPLTNLNQEEKTCKEIVGESVIKLLELVWIAVKVAAPIVMIVLSILDFTQAISSADSDYLNKAISKFTKRAVAIVCLFLTPVFVKTIGNLANFDMTCAFF